MIIHTMEQRSEAWNEIRKGRFTASDFDTLMPAKSKPIDSWTKTQLDIVYRVAAERMTGILNPSAYISASMQWGMDYEDEARSAYEMETGQEVQQVGFIERDEWIGCSPDGLVDNGGLEIKCPNSDTHLRYLHTPQGIYDDYTFQVQGSLYCAPESITFWDCLSYDPRFAPPKDYYCVRVYRDDALISLLDARLKCAILKVKEIMEG